MPSDIRMRWCHKCDAWVVESLHLSVGQYVCPICRSETSRNPNPTKEDQGNDMHKIIEEIILHGVGPAGHETQVRSNMWELLGGWYLSEDYPTVKLKTAE